jgi:ribosomal protein S18 acetylase RimI-like enzyme
MLVRTASAADIDAVLDLWAVASGPTRLANDRAVVERLLGRDPESLLVAEDGGAVVGSLIVGWDGWRCHLYRMAVAHAARRRGIADAMLAEAERRARALGARRIDAMVNRENEGGIAFWAAAGFEEDDHDARWSKLV